MEALEEEARPIRAAWPLPLNLFPLGRRHSVVAANPRLPPSPFRRPLRPSVSVSGE